MREQTKVQDELVIATLDAVALVVEGVEHYFPADVREGCVSALNVAMALMLELNETQTIAMHMVTLQTELHKRAISERDHWKANHANIVARSRILIDRQDLPIERVAAFHLIGKLQAELDALKAAHNC